MWEARGNVVSNGDTTLTVRTNTAPQLTPHEELCCDCQHFGNGFTIQNSYVFACNAERPALVSTTTQNIVWYDSPHTLASLHAIVEEAVVLGMVERLSPGIFRARRIQDPRNVREADEARAREIAALLNASAS